MSISPLFQLFGEPARQIDFVEGTLALWSAAPFVVSHIDGYSVCELALEIDSHIRWHFSTFDFVITVHDWSALTGYDTGCRKIMQQLTRFMRPKQREIIIGLGPADTLGKKFVRATAETITSLTGTPIEIFSDTEPFETRVRTLMRTYAVTRQSVRS